MKYVLSILAILTATAANAGTLTVVYTADNGNAVTNTIRINQSRAVAYADKVGETGGPAAKIARLSRDTLKDFWRSVIQASEDSDRLKAAIDAANAAKDNTDPTE